MRARQCVVELSSSSSDEDDDDDLICLSEVPAPPPPRQRRCLSSGQAPQVLPAVSPPVNDDLEILEYLGKRIEKHSVEKSSQRSSQNSSSFPDDDFCILDDDPTKADVVRTSRDSDDADDLVVTGETGPVACRDFPHARHLCVHFPFKTTAHQNFCSQCHCYVCDLLAPCASWGDGRRGGDHCHASDKKGEDWKWLREFNHSQKKALTKPQPDLPAVVQQVAVSRTSSQPANCTSAPGQSSTIYTPYEHFISRSQELVAQADGLLSDLFGSERLSRLTNFSGGSPRYNNTRTRGFSRGFSTSPSPITADLEATSQTGLVGTHHDPPARTLAPLQIRLSGGRRGSSSQPKPYHHFLDLGEQSKIHKSVRRKDSQFSRVHLPGRAVERPFERDGGMRMLLSRSSRNNGSTQSHLPCSTTSPASTQTSQSFSGFLQRPTEATVAQQPLEDPVFDLNLVLDNHFLKELSSPPTFLSSYLPFASGELQQPQPLQQHQCSYAETTPVRPLAQLSGSAAASQIQSEGNLYQEKGFGTSAGWSCNSTPEVGSQFSSHLSGSRTTMMEKSAEGTLGSCAVSPPRLLADYLVDSSDFWNDISTSCL